MELTTLVDYEFLYKLDIVHPKTEAPIGITMMIRSAASAEAKKIQRKHTDRHLEKRLRGKLIKGEQVESELLEEAASFIASWTWADGLTYKGGPPPELSVRAAIDLMETVPWIMTQVREAANNIENFSKG